MPRVDATKNVTVTMDEALLRRARIAAAEQGKSLSKVTAETMERRVGLELTPKDAIARFLTGPLMAATRQTRVGVGCAGRARPSHAWDLGIVSSGSPTDVAVLDTETQKH
jgi:hypothetical protein